MSRRSALAVVSLVLGIVAALSFATPANATAQTCISASQGYVCTIVYGSGQQVDSIGVSRGKVSWSGICNYSAWFFYVPPTGGAFGLGSQYRAGCTFVRAWFNQPIGWAFAHGTLLCAKFYEDSWATFIGEKCVGIS